jgi:hypothetical protein
MIISQPLLKFRDVRIQTVKYIETILWFARLTKNCQRPILIILIYMNIREADTQMSNRSKRNSSQSVQEFVEVQKRDTDLVLPVIAMERLTIKSRFPSEGREK